MAHDTNGKTGVTHVSGHCTWLGNHVNPTRKFCGFVCNYRMLLDICPEVYAASMNETELKSGDGLAEYSVTTRNYPLELYIESGAK